MSKYFFIDLETTGVEPKEHGIIQIGGVIEIDGEVKETVNCLVAPFPEDIIDDEALKVNGKTHEEIVGFKDPVMAHLELTTMMANYVDKYNRQDKFQFVGYNSGFDDNFLREFFRKCGDKYYGSFFSWPALDIAQIVLWYHLEKRHTFPSFKLVTVAKTLGIEVDENKAHDALYDIEITRKIFHKLREDHHGK